MSSNATASGEFSGTGENSGMVMSPPMTMFGPSAPNASLLPYPTSQSFGESASEGSSSQSSASEGESHVAIDVETESETFGTGTSRGVTESTSENDAYVTKYDTMPSQIYSAAEQLERLTGELMRLGLRECLVLVDNHRPVRTRTADVPAAFRSEYFQRMMVPVFSKAIRANSPYLRPVEAVDAEIAARVVLPPAPTPPPEPVTAPQPLPEDFRSNPVGFALGFWNERGAKQDGPPRRALKSKSKSKTKPVTPRGGKPPAFTVIEGRAGDNDDGRH